MIMITETEFLIYLSYLLYVRVRALGGRRKKDDARTDGGRTQRHATESDRGAGAREGGR